MERRSGASFRFGNGLLERHVVIAALRFWVAVTLLLGLPQVSVCSAETLTLDDCIYRAITDRSQQSDFDLLDGNLPEATGRHEIALKVKEYYYGILLAREMKGLLIEVRKDVTSAREMVQKQMDRNSYNVQEADVSKLDDFASEIMKDLAEAEMWESVGLSGLRAAMQLPREARVELVDATLVKADEPIADLDSYLARAEDLPHELRGVAKGLESDDAADWDYDNVELRIRQLHDEGVKAAAGIEASKRNYESFKKSAVTAMANFDFGVGLGSDVFDALQQYAKNRAAYYQSIFNYNVAVANLKYAVGEAAE